MDRWSYWALGGLRGPWESVLLLALVAWAVWTLRPANPKRKEGDAWLARLALLFWALTWVVPDTLGDTTLFSQRWMPWACIMGLLALPPAGVARRWRLGAAIAVVASQAIVTSYFWHRFDRLEMSGFRECLAAVPDHSRLLELDFVRFSPTIRMRLGPTFQMAAYAQLDRDVTLGYSFADAPTSLVVFKHGDWPWPWTRMLELRPSSCSRET